MLTTLHQVSIMKGNLHADKKAGRRSFQLVRNLMQSKK
jgi:hypothetical protein